ncbi:MAG: acyl-CoA thioesterase [Acidimicrobiales bacterium]
MTQTAGELLAFLDLEQIDRDIYRGRPGIWPSERATIYGGEVAAQALKAAAGTVATDRLPHSLHGYFLRRGDPSRPVVFMVDRDRDGRSFSARRVAAVQRGEVIWEMACSFHVVEDGPEYSQATRSGIARPANSPLQADSWCPLLEIRVPPPLDGSAPRPGPVDRYWARVAVPVPDDPVLHACLHAFTSDISSGFGDLDLEGVPRGGPSIDHALWFHQSSRADDWIIYDCVPAKVGGHRGLYTGTAHDLEGRLVAMFAQEMLLRPPAGPSDA